MEQTKERRHRLGAAGVLRDEAGRIALRTRTA